MLWKHLYLLVDLYEVFNLGISVRNLNLVGTYLRLGSKTLVNTISLFHNNSVLSVLELDRERYTNSWMGNLRNGEVT